LQNIFYTEATPKEYFEQGPEFPFPQPDSCLNPACLMPVPPKKHGFYCRQVKCFGFNGTIFIRRYYCPYCGMTFSYLPCFCLPYYRYSLELIFMGLLSVFNIKCSFDECVALLSSQIQHLSWEEQHLSFYARRFLANLSRIQMGLRQMIPDIPLPNVDSDAKEGAQKVLSIVTTGFVQIQTFSQRFFTQCKHSFMAPIKIL